MVTVKQYPACNIIGETVQASVVASATWILVKMARGVIGLTSLRRLKEDIRLFNENIATGIEILENLVLAQDPGPQDVGSARAHWFLGTGCQRNF